MGDRPPLLPISFSSPLTAHRRPLRPQPDQKRRLDCGRAREHALFGELDFAALARRQLTPPFVPKVASTTDTQYFDQSGREEEEEAASMQKMMKDAEYLQARPPTAHARRTRSTLHGDRGP